MSFKIGSLFSGSGGFELAATLCDIEPVWASEIEPYPIAVTSSRFPGMKHLGDISKVNGAEIEPVDIITFGSPCQDLSVAGKRAGLKHEDNGDDETTRSGLFMEAVRIIKEMRKATNGQYPKFCCWENVPGAFSSNDGEDFRIVLQELIKIAEPYAVMPEVPPKGWAYADSYSGDGWSLAYRVFDAQYWGVPQRRRRIYLVTDFRGGRAEEILFKREGLRGYFTESGTPWKAVTSDVEGSTGADDKEGAICYGISSYDSNSMKSDNPHSGVYEAETSRTLDLNGGNPACNQGGIAIVENLSATLATSNDPYLFQPIGFDGYNATETGDKSATLGVNCGMSNGRNGVITDTHILDDQGGSFIKVRTDGKAPTIRAQMGGHPPVVMIPASAEGLDAYNQTLTGDKAKTLNSAASDADHVPCAVYSVENHPADSRVNLDESGKVQTLTSRMGTGGGNVPMVMEPFCKSRRAKSADDATTWKHADVANTLNTFDQGEARANELVVHAVDQCGVAYGVTTKGNGDAFISEERHTALSVGGGQAGQGYPCTVYAVDQGGGKSQANVTEEKAPTLTCTHGGEPAVAYGFDPGASRDVGVLFIEECGKTLTNGSCPGHHDGVVISRPIHSMTTGDYMQVNEEKTATLLARDYKDPTCVEFFDAKERRYIVRRLTPTECARLQGFPDKWGHLEPKTELTDDEYRFWLEVRKTHDAINERAVKDYNPKQMLTWYNKLWTDSAEYKMWGNGIALPNALYVISGIKEALVNEQNERSKWLDDLLRG